jgi:hypothetical protein
MWMETSASCGGLHCPLVTLACPHKEGRRFWCSTDDPTPVWRVVSINRIQEIFVEPFNYYLSVYRWVDSLFTNSPSQISPTESWLLINNGQ